MARGLPTSHRRMFVRLKRVLCGVLFAAFSAFGESPVAELLRKNCVECHSDKIHTSGFSVETLDAVVRGGSKHGRAVITGNPQKSPLVQMLKGEIAPRMPMGRELAAADIARIEDWIRSLPPSTDATPGGEWRWPYQKPVKHDPPAAANASWVRNPIDNFISYKLEESGLRPAPPASKRTMARRVYFDLIGLPPTPDGAGTGWIWPGTARPAVSRATARSATSGVIAIG